MGPFLCLFCLLAPVLEAVKFNSSNFEVCPFTCSLSSEKELLCTTVSNEFFKSTVVCHRDSLNDRFVIGNRSSIRRVFPSGLKELSKFGSEGTLNIFLNMNILELTVTSFAGLENLLINLQVLHVTTLHPNTFLNHRRFGSLIFDGDRVPKLPDDVKEKKDVPAFLRLRPEDPTMPIEVNIEARCHKCANDEPLQDLVILTFPLQDSPNSGGKIDALTIFYMDSCPTLSGGLGCPKNGSDNEFIVNASAMTGWNITVEEPTIVTTGGLVKLTTGSGRMKPLMLSVVIWCTVLTVLLICLVAFMIIRRRLRTKKEKMERQLALQHRYSPASLKHIVCGTASCEELHRNSLSNGGTWAYGTPSQDSCSNLLSETRSQYSFRPPYQTLGYSHPRGGVYAREYDRGYRSSIPDYLNMIPRQKSSLGNGDAYPVNGDPNLPPLPPGVGFRVPNTPTYKRSHDGTFRMQ
ncbi:unnamed protein product [Mesocestoides corti]|uniref:Protein kinase domain-containing protein n=1 Tax=Mesocestoides corti TaxID=53468 RepID=A0A0R3UF69_MESCO|nr:unnamed protein product [Mesocestoides corti]